MAQPLESGAKGWFPKKKLMEFSIKEWMGIFGLPLP